MQGMQPHPLRNCLGKICPIWAKFEQFRAKVIRSEQIRLDLDKIKNLASQKH